jgi:hypothetical protein
MLMASRSRVWLRLRTSGIPGLLLVSCLLTAFSEAFYWYPGGTDYPVRVLFYLIPTAAFLWTLNRYRAAGWTGLILIGAVYGFVTEGVLTTVLYGGFPFDPFAISYTSLAWHDLVSVGFGLFVLHRLLASGRVLPAVLAVGAFGMLWGLWATGLQIPDGASDDSEGIPLFMGQVSVTLFAVYTVAVTLVVGVCHALLGRVVGTDDLVPGRRPGGVVLVVGVAFFAVLIVPLVPWAPVVLGMLLWLCHRGLSGEWRFRQGAAPSANPAIAGQPGLLGQLARPVPWSRLPILIALPAGAIVTYGGLEAAALDEATIRDLCLNLVVAVQTIAGWAAFIAALVVLRRMTIATGSSPAPAQSIG